MMWIGAILAIGVLIVCVFGVLAVLRVPVQMIPDLEARVITVRTSWSGATPRISTAFTSTPQRMVSCDILSWRRWLISSRSCLQKTQPQ